MSRGIRNCEVCSTQYEPTYSKQRTCSRTCGVTLRRTITGTMAKIKPPKQATTYDRTCAECEKPFTTTHHKQVLCSKECAAGRSRRQAADAYRDGRTRDNTLKSVHMQRARRAGVEAEAISPEAVAERDNWICGICFEPVPKTWPEDDRSQMPSLDHIVPIEAGGTHTLDNVQLAHYSCNLRKGSRPVTDYVV